MNNMTQEEFLNTVWRLEELLMNLDYLRDQIGNCPKGCDQEDEGLCDVCCDWFVEMSAEEKRLEGDKEYNEIMRKLKEACDQDKSGRYQRILEQSRQGKAIH